MTSWASTVGLACALAVSTVRALQMGATTASNTRQMQLITLDEKEVASRGSHCLDGSAPGFYHKQGTDEGKWVFWLKGGGLCLNEADCFDYLPVVDLADNMDSMPLHDYGDFANYHHVLVANCDLGLYMGNRPDPVVHNGQTLYFQGARIIKHVVDVLQTNYSMTDVLFAGGSGGGQALYIGADYFKSVMPTSVKKFGVAPMNGWYVEQGIDELKDIYSLANMESSISDRCKQSFSATERYNCVDPATAYRHSEANSFITQIFDYTFMWNKTGELSTAWYNCLDGSTSRVCTDDDAGLLQEHLDNYTSMLKTYPKYTERGHGGYMSTCTTHTFYNDDTFNQYANNGVTDGEAISRWWHSLGTDPAPTWYLPCTLGPSQHVQCENTC